MTYLIPRLLKTPWYSQRLLEWHYWLSTVGHRADGVRPDHPGRVPGALLVVADALGPLDRDLDPVLGGAAGGRAADVRGLAGRSCSTSLQTLAHGSRPAASEEAGRRGRLSIDRLDRAAPSSIRGFAAHAGIENGRLLHRGARLLRPGVPVQRAGAGPDVSPSARADGRAARREQRQPAVSVRRPGPAISRQLHRGLRPPARGRRGAREVARRRSRRRPSGWATRSTSARAAGTATASSSARCRTRIGAGGRSRRPRNTRTSCSAP